MSGAFDGRSSTGVAAGVASLVLRPDDSTRLGGGRGCVTAPSSAPHVRQEVSRALRSRCRQHTDRARPVRRRTRRRTLAHLDQRIADRRRAARLGRLGCLHWTACSWADVRGVILASVVPRVDRGVGRGRRGVLRLRAPGCRAPAQDRYADPLRQPARGRCRPHRQRRGGVRAPGRSGRRGRLRYRHHDRRHRTRTAPTWAARSRRASRPAPRRSSARPRVCPRSISRRRRA